MIDEHNGLIESVCKTKKKKKKKQTKNTLLKSLLAHFDLYALVHQLGLRLHTNLVGLITYMQCFC